MLKTNKILTAFVAAVIGVFAFTGSASALTNQVQIQQLPGYVNTNNFKISCSAITNALTDGDPNTTTKVQFYVSKNGGSDISFGPSIDLSLDACQVQVTNLQITEEANYKFTVKLDSSESSSTSTIFDNSGPSPVSGFYKDGLSDGYRLHYHTPSDSDFDRVIIYRGDAPGFEADSSHEIGTVTCCGNSDMTYEDHSGTNKFYLIRVLDHAGNSSGLVGDGGTVTTETLTPSSPAGSVTQLPREDDAEGSVLGTEATPEAMVDSTPESTLEPTTVEKINQFANSTPQPFKWILTHKKIFLGSLVILITVGYLLSKRKKS